MKTLQQREYISIQQGCQQLKLEICGVREYKAEKDEFYRQVSAQLEELDYRELYSAYSGMIRKSQVEPRIMFELLICAYMEGVYSSRKIERLCRNHIQFILILDGHAAPDHCAIARFRSGKKTGKALEGLFRQYVKVLVKKGWVTEEEVFIDGTKIESKANRYTFVWRKTVERELKKIKEKAREMLAAEEGYVTRKKLEESVERLESEIEKKGLKVEKGRGHHKPAKIRERDKQKALLERWKSYEEKKAILSSRVRGIRSVQKTLVSSGITAAFSPDTSIGKETDRSFCPSGQQVKRYFPAGAFFPPASVPRHRITSTRSGFFTVLVPLTICFSGSFSGQTA